MRRRDLLRVGGAAALGGLAGCGGFLERESSRSPPLVEDRPDAVYLPTHVEGMKLVDVKTSGRLACALTYTYPHRFWLVTGQRRERVTVDGADAAHVMPVVWDRETGIVPPDRNPGLTVRQGDETVTELSPWVMLSQPMGVHFGDNVPLNGDGTYEVVVDVGSPSTRRTGSLADGGGSTQFTFSMDFRESTLEDIDYRDIPADRQGTPGAVDPMGGDRFPTGQLPETDALPGTVRGTATSGDAVLAVTTLSDAARFGGAESETYLAVSMRTPYNRYPLPLASLSATLTRDGESVADGILQSTIDPALGYHYGRVVPAVESGDQLAVTVDAPPQVARHEGYETAFVEMGDVTVTL